MYYGKISTLVRLMILIYVLLFSYLVCFSSYRNMENISHHSKRQLHIGNCSNNSISIVPCFQLKQLRSLQTPSNETTLQRGKLMAKTLTDESTNSAFSTMNHLHTSENINLNLEAVLVVIVSDRYEGIIPTVASIVKHTKSKPIDLVLIGNTHDANERVRQHFMMHHNKTTATNQRDRVVYKNNIRTFASYSTLDIQTDLMNQGYQPIWTWEEWGSSRQKSGDASWFRTNYTIHVAEWDDLETHAHVLNHIRFYLPHISHFRNHSYLYFVDDDILVQKDLGIVADAVMNTLDKNKGMVTPCNIWIWDNKCNNFNFHNVDTISSILQTPSLYGDRNVCLSSAETHCYPSTYSNFLESMLNNVTNTTKEISRNINDSNNPRNQKAWNFGFSLFALDNWRRMDLTSRYETVMKESYRLHVFPETSLTFGLGVSYIAFAGAVDCWNDNILKVRDGFGFIEYRRFAQTFGGDDFINTHVDVIHFTGPTKPWVANTTIEAQSVQPWLNYMMDEGMGMPEQLPKENGRQLFTLLASDRAGAQWIMSLLDDHPAVCASGESRKPESGFPADVMQPWGTPWLPVCSIKRGCSFAFIHDAISDLVDSIDRRGRTNRMPTRCEPNFANKNDELGHHLPRVCSFFRSLNWNFSESAIAAKWVEAFRDENQDLLPCSCPRGTSIKGVKVLVDWLMYQNYPNQPMGPAEMILNDTAISGSKVIRLKRRNSWERYLSSVVAQHSNVYHVKSGSEKTAQLAAAGNITISIDDMLTKISNMEAIDVAGDNWARQHASSLLEVYHEDCKLNVTECFRQIFEFLEVDKSYTPAKISIFEPVLASTNLRSTSLHITNKGAVEEALAVNGYGKHVGMQNFSIVQLLIYDDSETVDKIHQYHSEKGINAIMFGRKEGSNKKYFSKFAAAIPLLKRMAPDAIVVLSDHRDISVSFPPGSDFTRYKAINDFRQALYDLLKNYTGAIVASADSVCCSSALTHVKLGGLFQADGTRKSRSCVSGDVGCEWAGDDKAKPWQDFMMKLAAQRGYADNMNVYLNGSLLAGKASDLLALVQAVKIGKAEDSRAVLSDFMYHNPDKLILDYDDQLFGKNREGTHGSSNIGCPFNSHSSSVARMLKVSNTAPLFLETPRELGCLPGQKIVSNPIFPRWAETGIEIRPILDHLERVENINATITSISSGKPIYYQGPELLYFVDGMGVWTSKLIRDRTDNLTLVWRTEPTEGLMFRAYNILKSSSAMHQRWSLARKSLKTGGFPFWAWYGDFKSCNFQNFRNYSIPLFTPSAMANCDHAFPIPNYMNMIDSQPTSDNWRGLFRDTNVAIPWKSKIRKVVWRGSLSESTGDLVLSSTRWLVNKLVYGLDSGLYDVGLTSIPSWVTSQVYVNISEVGGLKSGLSPMSEFQRFMAILDMDGNSWSSRFASLLCYNSVIIKVEPKHVEYIYSTLYPWTHYIPVKADLSDLHENVEWALNPDNEATVQDIIFSANEWCSRRMVPDELAHDMLDIWESYVRNLNRDDTSWQKQWVSKKSSILSSTSSLDFFRLRD